MEHSGSNYFKTTVFSLRVSVKNNGFVFAVRAVSNRIALGCYHKEKADNFDFTHGYRLCVLASGSLITDIFSVAH